MSEFQKTLEQMLDRRVVVGLLATVDSVDEGQLTFDCTPVGGGAAILDVRIRPVAGPGDQGVSIIPKVGSKVVALSMGGAQWIMLTATEWSSVKIMSAKSQLTMDANGLVEVAGDKILAKSNDLVLGSQQGAEPMVKGDALGDRHAEIYTHLAAIQQSLLALATAGAAACLGPLAPLAPSFTALGAAISTELGPTTADQAKFSMVKSQMCKTA